MPWQLDSKNPATITPNPGRPDFTVSLHFTHTNGELYDYTEPYVPDLNNVPRLAAGWLRQNNLFDSQINNLPSGADIIAAVDGILNPAPPPETTPEVAARFAYNLAKDAYTTVQKLVADKGLLPDDPKVTAATEALELAAKTFAASAAAPVIAQPPSI